MYIVSEQEKILVLQFQGCQLINESKVDVWLDKILVCLK